MHCQGLEAPRNRFLEDSQRVRQDSSQLIHACHCLSNSGSHSRMKDWVLACCPLFTVRHSWTRGSSQPVKQDQGRSGPLLATRTAWGV
eukprot:6208989-Pleurochrysis_carterae.AAC.1